MEIEGSGPGMLPDRPKRVAPSRSRRFQFRTAAETGSFRLFPSAHAELLDRRGESGPMFVSFAALNPVQRVLNRNGDRTGMPAPPANEAIITRQQHVGVPQLRRGDMQGIGLM